MGAKKEELSNKNANGARRLAAGAHGGSGEHWLSVVVLLLEVVFALLALLDGALDLEENVGLPLVELGHRIKVHHGVGERFHVVVLARVRDVLKKNEEERKSSMY